MTGVPASVKSTLEILIPIQDFAAGITLGRNPDQQDQALDLIQGNCSNDFNRMVWSQSRFVPNSGMSADTFLQSPVKSMAIGDKEVVVNFGDQKYGAKVTLRHEYDRYIVDDVVLIAGPEESQRLALRQTLRTQLANGKARGPQNVLPASFTPTEDGEVEQAVHQTSDESQSDFPTAVNPPRELEPADDDAEPLDPFTAVSQQEP